MTPNTELSDERIFGLAKQHFGGSGHNLIWQDDPRYAAACDMPTDARWSVSAVRAEQTLAFARAILAASPAPLREAVEPVAWAVKDADGKLLISENRTLLSFFDNPPRALVWAGIEADGDGGKGPARLKDHLIAQTVNALVETCRTYGHTQQLRERIAGLIVPFLKHAGSPTSPPNGKTEGDPSRGGGQG
jgi:hypothetical protein